MQIKYHKVPSRLTEFFLGRNVPRVRFTFVKPSLNPHGSYLSEVSLETEISLRIDLEVDQP